MRPRHTAARFSFLLSLPAVFAAGAYELYKERKELLATQEHVVNLVVASVVAGVVGYATIAFLLGYLKTHSTWVFIGYRLALGALILALLSAGYLRPNEGAVPEGTQAEVGVPALAGLASPHRLKAELQPLRVSRP